MLKRSLVVSALNVLIVIALLAGVGALGAIFVTIASSAPSLSIGSVTSTTSGTVTQIQAPISVSNKGYFSFSDIAVQVTVKDSSNDQLLSGAVGPVSITPGETKQISAGLSLDTSKLPAAVVEKLATSSQNLTVTATVAGTLPPFIAITGAVSAQLPWGAPVNNLVVGTTSFTPLNATAVTVTVPVSFQNANNYLAVSGTGRIAVLDGSGKQVGGGAVQVNAPPKARFQQNVSLVVGIPTSQIQSLLFNDQNLSYRAVLNFQSGGQTVFTLTEPITYAWKAPLSSLSVGSPSVAPFNSTSVQVTMPVSFTNRNSILDLSTSVNAAIFNATSGAQLGSGSLSVNAPHGSNFSGNLVGYLKFSPSTITILAFNNGALNLKATLSGTYSGFPFSFDKAVSVNWGAPLASFAIGSASVGSASAQGVQVTVPVSFENNSPWLAVSSPVSVTLVNATSGATLGTSTIQVNVQPGQKFSQSVGLTMTLPQSTLSTLLSNDETLSLTVKVAGQYAGFNVATQSGLLIKWGAPVKNLALGSLTVSPYNSTYAQFSVPISFTDNSLSLSLSGTVSGKVFDANNNQVGSITALTVSAQPGQAYTATLTSFVKLSAANGKTFSFSLTFNTSFGTITKVVTISA